MEYDERRVNFSVTSFFLSVHNHLHHQHRIYQKITKKSSVANEKILFIKGVTQGHLRR